MRADGYRTETQGPGCGVPGATPSQVTEKMAELRRSVDFVELRVDSSEGLTHLALPLELAHPCILFPTCILLQLFQADLKVKPKQETMKRGREYIVTYWYMRRFGQKHREPRAQDVPFGR